MVPTTWTRSHLKHGHATATSVIVELLVATAGTATVGTATVGTATVGTATALLW